MDDTDLLWWRLLAPINNLPLWEVQLPIFLGNFLSGHV
jgi:hypothetical protein